MLWHSHAGVPFWEKWGGLTGALVVYHVLVTSGPEEVARKIKNEPFSLFLTYDKLSKEHADWPRLPQMLVEDARRELNRHGAPETGKTPNHP